MPAHRGPLSPQSRWRRQGILPYRLCLTTSSSRSTQPDSILCNNLVTASTDADSQPLDYKFQAADSSVQTPGQAAQPKNTWARTRRLQARQWYSRRRGQINAIAFVSSGSRADYAVQLGLHFDLIGISLCLLSNPMSVESGRVCQHQASSCPLCAHSLWLYSP